MIAQVDQLHAFLTTVRPTPVECAPRGSRQAAAPPGTAAVSEPNARAQPMPASPYSTGGGGTVLEHRYGAVLLAALLTGDPVPALAGAFTVTDVAF